MEPNQPKADPKPRKTERADIPPPPQYENFLLNKEGPGIDVGGPNTGGSDAGGRSGLREAGQAADDDDSDAVVNKDADENLDH